MTDSPNQAVADVAVVIPTVLRPSLVAAARSVFMQELDGRIHLLIAVDVAKQSREILDAIRERTLVEKIKAKMAEAWLHWQNGAIAELIECCREVPGDPPPS
jgi:hypothetical protein